MTNKEAIEIIKIERNHCATHNQDEGMSEQYHKEMQSLVDAFDLAIKALEEHPTDKEIQDDMRRTYLGGKKEIGCTHCPYAGHIELKECPDAYTEVSQYCNLYDHEPIEQKGGQVVPDTLQGWRYEERPQGEWIFRRGVTCGGYYKCNKCGEVERAEKNYCPNCGAKMRGKEE